MNEKKKIEWIKVDCQYPELEPCWECSSHKGDAKGYPRHNVNGTNTKMCRTIYSEMYGEIPDGLVVRHKCDNPKCINPNHLEIGTRKDNADDRSMRGRNRTPLTKEQVVKIRKDTRPYKLITKDYGIAASTISNIKSRFRWGWLS